MRHAIDTHIHLIAPANENVWKWQSPHPLSKNRRLDEYCTEENPVPQKFTIDGVIWIEADAHYNLENGIHGVKAPIRECMYVSRYNAVPMEGEGTAKPGYIKVMVPWAPIPWGKDLWKYEKALREALLHEYSRVKGFRFLLQDKPAGTITSRGFLDGLRWMQDQGYIFEWGIDMHHGGMWQLEESVIAFREAPQLKYIINHLTKPAVDICVKDIEDDERFREWKRLMAEMRQAAPNSYMKVSGCFSEFSTQLGAVETAQQIFPWFKVCYELWGPSHMIWGSNWPVCSIKAGPNLTGLWYDVTEELFNMVAMSEAERTCIYSSNYLDAYNLRVTEELLSIRHHSCYSFNAPKTADLIL